MSHLYILISSISSVQTHKLILVVTAYLWLQTHSGAESKPLGTDSSWWCQNISGYRLILVVTEYFWVQTHSGGVRTFLGTDSFWWCQNISGYRLILVVSEYLSVQTPSVCILLRLRQSGRNDSDQESTYLASVCTHLLSPKYTFTKTVIILISLIFNSSTHRNPLRFF